MLTVDKIISYLIVYAKRRDYFTCLVAAICFGIVSKKKPSDPEWLFMLDKFLLLNDLNLHGIQTFLSSFYLKLHFVILANLIDETTLMNKDVFA